MLAPALGHIHSQTRSLQLHMNHLQLHKDHLKMRNTSCWPTPSPPHPPQIIAASGEKLSAARKEIEVLRALSHAHCLHLLDHAISPGSSSSSLAYNVLLVFPAYEVRDTHTQVCMSHDHDTMGHVGTAPGFLLV
jgi:hypothetical protein